MTPREMLGLFLGSRGRHFNNTDREEEAERDYLWARALFPRNRELLESQVRSSIYLSQFAFEQGERSHPYGLAKWLSTMRPPSVVPAPTSVPRKENHHVNARDAFFQCAVDFRGR